MPKRSDKGLETTKVRLSQGIIRIDFSSISSMCMTYAPFSYQWFGLVVVPTVFRRSHKANDDSHEKKNKVEEDVFEVLFSLLCLLLPTLYNV